MAPLLYALAAGPAASAGGPAGAPAALAVGTFGKTAVGASRDSGMFANYKIVNAATLSVSGSVTKLSVYAVPGINSTSPQSLKAVLYADSGGSPGALIATGTAVNYSGAVNGSGWFDLPFASPVALSPGTYWLGFITGAGNEGMGYVYDKVSGSRAYNGNAYASGPTNPFGSATKDSEQASIYATYTTAAPPALPVNLSAPTISGVAQVGQTLGASTGSWSESPSAYQYQWQSCDAQGANCSPIPFATLPSYTIGSTLAGSTVRVSVTATNSAGPSAAASSIPTAAIPRASLTFGSTTPGASLDSFVATRKLVSPYVLPTAGTVDALVVYLQPTGVSGVQLLKGVLYTDSGGAAGALLGASISRLFTSTAAAGWFEFRLPVNLRLPAGKYWIGVIAGASSYVTGFRYDTVAGGGAYNLNEGFPGTAGPTNPFGPAVSVSEQMSIYGTYRQITPPANRTPPTLSGTPQTGQTLSAEPGSWSEHPTSYSYQWRRCDAQGSNCAAIPLATAQSYTVGAADAGATLRVSVSAANAAGSSPAVASAPTSVVSSTVSHFEYVFTDGLVSVYDMDKGFGLVKTISLPQTSTGMRGVTVSPATHMLFVSYGGDGGVFGNGSVLAYNLLTESVVWTVHLNTGVDSGQVSPDGTRLYMPTGENDPSGIWNILDTSNGALLGTIQGGASAHNTVVSADGRYVYLGGRQHGALDVYDTSTRSVREIGPLFSGVRPFTVNGSNTLAFTTASGLDGFQVSSITTGGVLFTVSFGSVPGGFPYTAPSHGASLSPDEKQLYVIDSVNKDVAVYDVSKVAEGVAPTQLGLIPASGLVGSESSCAYDCGRSGWLQHSIDGRFVFVGDSGEVIETATRKVLTIIPALLNTKKSLEIDWSGGVPIATSGRVGVGHPG